MMKQFFCLLLAVLLLAGCISSRQSGTAYGPGWSAVHADGRNSDCAPFNGPGKITPAWQRKFDGRINLGATTSRDGKVFVTTSGKGCHLYALDARTGETLWCTEEVNRFAVASSALLDREGHIYLADNEAMHAFDGKGALLWETPITGFPLSAQFTQTGRLIFITHIGKVYVLDRKTGQPLIGGWDLSPGNMPDAGFDPVACMKGTEACPCANTLAFDQQNGRFYFTYWKPGTASAALRAMQYTEQPVPTVTMVWENSALPGGSASSPDIAANGSRVYVNDNAGFLYALDAGTGHIIWKYEIGFEPGGSQSTSPDGYIMPAGANGARLLCIKDLGAHAELVWQCDSLHNRGVATQAGGKLAYCTVASGRGRFQNDLVVVNVLTGEILDREPLPGVTIFTVGTTLGPEGNIYVPSFNGALFAFRPD
ncbi:outer membrane protein assembly factor BamB family protein [Chitinophaga japonensis]|uniref:Outer membrane protein assembly factor BamB n=1 Tax=Chitinophaga japonensis TaxID=104662 RepID=A0A562TBG2_CHIJA|nr:PQQ-binding-like beta-propeller repeat protein [Chitinophaga japonensis]TWI90927.1 outer membrane protein assembly factor BamB [Chitinophaga japonensis]